MLLLGGAAMCANGQAKAANSQYTLRISNRSNGKCESALISPDWEAR
jgi:hypothetical protein